MVIREGSAASAATNAANIPPPVNAAAGEVNQEQRQGFKREADQYMPIANITRTMRRVLPAHARITDDAKEAIQECVSEFISFITVEANMRCHRDYRKTVTPEDVLAAMKSLGFDDYLQPLAVFLNKYRTQQDPERDSTNQLLQFVRRDNNAAVGGGFVHHHQQQQQQQGAQMVRPPPPPPTAPTMWYYAPLSLPPAASVEDEEKIGGSQR
ncbi:PREDICTED: nuclear transcription factor Y subunit B-3-like [Erythranthe guttata]|uniref:nuclear transcription factor Y subunit B-3-like n=1 Tax=Erythranthe guttata TaxID=4155 RepID=UPI00064D978F|nr:PREDICTED: nuclear transcription factor Y subunit B-3-like [Erythranthe guttata]|eukprot:XP_012836454.1 PREDICTED: nuclear transcription factor Y subunit B-3-like [Erythranthe guttata]